MTPRAGRFRRTMLAALVTAAVVIPVSAAARPSVPAPAPAVLAPVSAQTLNSRYEANHDNIVRAARMAQQYGRTGRAGRLSALAGPGRHFLSFDGRGAGRAVEVFGDLAAADRIAVLVPGSDTGLDTYSRFSAGAGALHRELGSRAAVITWLGYDTPGTVSPEVLTTGRADEAARALRTFVAELHGAGRPGARVSLLCHSYGSVVCGRAASGLQVADIVLYGSPGAGRANAAELRTSARVWAGRGSGDWIANVPHTSIAFLDTEVGFGADPADPAFGARPFAAGDADHSGYLRPDSVSLRSLARIVLGSSTEAAGA
ncbi:alpha/beta hydrolase [Streptomyces sp. NPDC054887]